MDITDQAPRRRRPIEDIPHKQASDVRVVDVPARAGVMAHKDYLVTTACGEEMATTLVTTRDDKVRCPRRRATRNPREED